MTHSFLGRHLRGHRVSSNNTSRQDTVAPAPLPEIGNRGQTLSPTLKPRCPFRPFRSIFPRGHHASFPRNAGGGPTPFFKDLAGPFGKVDSSRPRHTIHGIEGRPDLGKQKHDIGYQKRKRAEAEAQAKAQADTPRATSESRQNHG